MWITRYFAIVTVTVTVFQYATPSPPLLALYAIYYYTLIVANNAGSYLLVDYSAIV